MRYLIYLFLLSIGPQIFAQPSGFAEVELCQGKFKTVVPADFIAMDDTLLRIFFPENDLPDLGFYDTASQHIVSFKMTPFGANDLNLNIYMKTFVEGFAQMYPEAHHVKANFVPFKKRRVGFIQMVYPQDTSEQFTFQYFTHISDSLFLANISGPFQDSVGIQQLSRLIFQMSAYRDKPIGQVTTLSEQLICDGEVTFRETLYKPVIKSKEKEEGIIFVEIKIDRAGKVTHTRWLQEDSTTENEVLIQHCLEAASQYRFNAKLDAPTEQIAALKFTFSNPDSSVKNNSDL